MMELVEKYYQIVETIRGCKTLGALAICEEMINTVAADGLPLTASYLADEALQKRVLLLTTRYAETE